MQSISKQHVWQWCPCLRYPNQALQYFPARFRRKHFRNPYPFGWHVLTRDVLKALCRGMTRTDVVKLISLPTHIVPKKYLGSWEIVQLTEWSHETSNQQSLPQESFQCTPSICNLSISTTENPRSLEGTHALTKDAISLWMYWYTNVGYGMLKSERTFTSWHVMVYSKRKLGYSTVVGNSFRSLWHGIAWTPSCWVSWIQKKIFKYIKGLRLLKGDWNVMQPATTIRLDKCWKFWNFHDDPTELLTEHLLQHHGLKHLRQLLVSKLLMQHLDMEQLWSAIPCYPSCFNFFYSVRCALRLALKRVWSLKFVTALTALLLILVP